MQVNKKKKKEGKKEPECVLEHSELVSGQSMHHVFAALNSAVGSSSVDPIANKEQGSVHWCGVATHLLTTTLFGVGVFRQGVQSLETRCSIRQL